VFVQNGLLVLNVVQQL